MASTGGENKQISIHVREDSDSELQALFDISLKGGLRPLQIPLRMRNFPASFWQPPTVGSRSPSVHSRENSLDNSCGPFSPGTVPSPQPPGAGGAPHHIRTASCPATIGQTLAVAQQNQSHNQQLQHLRQQSYDVTDDLPPGWEMAKAPNGQIYFMNHITKTTQWEDPRKAIHQQMLNQLNGTASPRSSAVQSPVPNANGGLDLGPLPQGWEQSVTAEGEVYFIHHVTKRTTWYDPRIPIHAQVVPQKQGQESALSQAQKIQQERRLRRLENERRVLQQKRAELNQFIKQQGRDTSSQLTQQALAQTQDMMMRHSLAEGTTVLEELFLGQQQQQQQQQQGEVHNRQESADSGLGMGSNFNLGSIPEDMGLESMDTDLDTTLTDTSQQQQQQVVQQQQQQQVVQQQQQQVVQQQQQVAVAQGGMETDELIPTLPELGEELSRDFINTIFSANPVVENELTWL